MNVLLAYMLTCLYLTDLPKRIFVIPLLRNALRQRVVVLLRHASPAFWPQDHVVDCSEAMGGEDRQIKVLPDDDYQALLYICIIKNKRITRRESYQVTFLCKSALFQVNTEPSGHYDFMLHSLVILSAGPCTWLTAMPSLAFPTRASTLRVARCGTLEALLTIDCRFSSEVQQAFTIRVSDSLRSSISFVLSSLLEAVSRNHHCRVVRQRSPIQGFDWPPPWKLKHSPSPKSRP